MGRKLHIALVILITLGVGLFVMSIPSIPKTALLITHATPTPTKPIALDANILWNKVQGWRESQGLHPYIKDDFLCKFAIIRLEEIKTDWSHNKFSAKRLCGDMDCTVGENLASDMVTETNALISWINSPDHLRELKYDYKYSCIETSGSYAVQIFGNY